MAIGRDREALAAYNAAVHLGPKGHLSTNPNNARDAAQLAAAEDQHLECKQNRGILHKRLDDCESAIEDLQGAVCERVSE